MADQKPGSTPRPRPLGVEQAAAEAAAEAVVNVADGQPLLPCL